MIFFAQIIVMILLACLVAGSLLNLSSSPHWFVRGWDFPRVQIVAIAWFLTLCFSGLQMLGTDSGNTLWIVCLVTTCLLTVWHGYQIAPYTPLARKQAKSTRPELLRDLTGEATVRVVISNLEMENKEHASWIDVMRTADPDILIVLEPNSDWIDAIDPMLANFPHRIVLPQDNYYGMVMASKLPIASHKIHHLVQDDIPSIDARIQLRDGRLIRVVSVHPRPPEPMRDNDAVARDAELTLWGKELSEDDGPIIIGGDLNDVAWSSTTRLFLRMSGMLDPRRGRGFFNTFNADHVFMRFPLDHIFHSPHFTVNRIERLSYVGSDHFPMLIELRFTPEDKHRHEVLEAEQDDDEEADLRIEWALEDEEVDGEIARKE